MGTEVIYEDGSVSQFTEAGSIHDSGIAMARFALLGAKYALFLNLNTGMEPRAGYLKYVAIPNITAVTGRSYLTSTGRLTSSGKRAALRDCELALAAIEAGAVVVEFEDDVS